MKALLENKWFNPNAVEASHKPIIDLQLSKAAR